MSHVVRAQHRPRAERHRSTERARRTASPARCCKRFRRDTAHIAVNLTCITGRWQASLPLPSSPGVEAKFPGVQRRRMLLVELFAGHASDSCSNIFAATCHQKRECWPCRHALLTSNQRRLRPSSVNPFMLPCAQQAQATQPKALRHIFHASQFHGQRVPIDCVQRSNHCKEQPPGSASHPCY